MTKQNSKRKPKAKLVGKDSNAFNLLGIAGAALRKAGMDDQVKEMNERVWASHSFDEALWIILEYVDAY